MTSQDQDVKTPLEPGPAKHHLTPEPAAAAGPAQRVLDGEQFACAVHSEICDLLAKHRLALRDSPNGALLFEIESGRPTGRGLCLMQGFIVRSGYTRLTWRDFEYAFSEQRLASWGFRKPAHPEDSPIIETRSAPEAQG